MPWLALVRTAAEARKAQAEGKLFAFLSVEGMEPVGDRLERLEQYAQWGVRMGMLTWNEENLLACGADGDPDKGLTALGREAVRRMQRLNILPDVSHTSDRSFWDIMDLAEGPVIASHSNCRALCDVRRDLTDEQPRAIRDTGGVVGVNVSHDFVHKEPRQQTAAMLARHAAHMAEVMGPEHVACGFDFCKYFGPGYEGARAWRDCGQAQNFFFELERIGFSEAERQAIASRKSPAGAGIKRIVLCGKTGGRPPVFRFLHTVAKMMERPTEKGLNYSYI
ncbi:MAG: dipeptidase [Dysosmobacter sp.]